MLSSQLKPFKLNLVLNVYEKDEDNIIKKKVIEPITNFNGLSATGHFATYEEELSLKENSQFTFSFKIINKYNDKINPYFNLITLGRQLRLDYEDLYYYMIIVNISPTIHDSFIEYSVECQDIFSYYLSHNNINATFADADDAEQFEFTGKNIGELSRKVLSLSNLKDWEIDPTLELQEFKSFPMSWYGETNHYIAATSTLNLDSSNTFNALVEIATLFNAEIVVRYPQDPEGQKIIYFKNKEYPFNSYNVFEQNVNLSNLQVSYETSDFCSMLYVEGGETADGNIVSLTTPIPISRRKAISEHLKENPDKIIVNDIYFPEAWPKGGSYRGIKSFPTTATTSEEVQFESMLKKIPALGSTLYDFSYFENTHLMNSDYKKALLTELTGRYFDANLKLQLYSEHYFEIVRKYQRTLALEEETISLISAEYKLLCEMKVDGTADTRISKPLINSDSDDSETSDSASTMFETTKELDCQSVIDDLTQKLWLIWSSTKEDDNYMEAHASYAGANFIIDRIQSYSEKVAQLVEKFNKNEQEIATIINNYVENNPYTNRSLSKRTMTVSENSFNLHYISTEVGDTYKKDFKASALEVSKKSDNDYGRLAALWNEQNAIEQNLGYCIGTDYYPGYYTGYIEILISLYEVLTAEEPDEDLEDLIDNYEQWIEDPVDWISVYNEAMKNRETIWQEIMEKYGEFIIEGFYSDENQLDSYGLYLAALTQFTTMTQPNFVYNMEITDWNLLTNCVPAALEIGDIIAVRHTRLGFNNAKQRKVILRCEVEKPEKNIDTWYFTYNEKKYRGRLKYICGHYYLDFTIEINSNNYLLQWDKIVKELYYEQDQNPIKVRKAFIVHDSDNLEMAVTEISKSLRSGTLRLNVSNAFSMRKMAYKILKSSRYY